VDPHASTRTLGVGVPDDFDPVLAALRLAQVVWLRSQDVGRVRALLLAALD